MLMTLFRSRLAPKFGPLLLITAGLLAVGAVGSQPSQGGSLPAVSPVRVAIPGAEVKRAGLSAQLVQTSAVIHAPQARSTFGVDGSGLTCAVLDSGLRVTHVDFAGRVVATRNFTTENGGDPANVTDVEGHGTNATGIIAANEVHTGIAPGANIAAVKVLNNSGVGSSTVIGNGLQWVIDNHAALKISVVNMSLGNGENFTSHEAYDAAHPGDPGGIRAKIQALRALNIPVVVAAGNEFARSESQQGMSWPAIFPETISVGATYDANVGADELDGGRAATTRADRITPYSQRLHPSVNDVDFTDLFAPGALLTSSGRSGDRASSTFHGTSESAPVVTGVIMLIQQLIQRETGALPSIDNLERWLRDGAVTINDGDDEDDNVQNTGLNFLRVDALGALKQIEVTPPPPQPGKMKVTPLRLNLTGRQSGRVRIRNIGGEAFTATLPLLLGSSPFTADIQVTPTGSMTVQPGKSAFVTVQLQRRPRRRFVAELWVSSDAELPPNNVAVELRVKP